MGRASGGRFFFGRQDYSLRRQNGDEKTGQLDTGIRSAQGSRHFRLCARSLAGRRQPLESLPWMQGRGRIVRPRHPNWGLQMKYIFVPLLVALAGWGIRPALADDIHDALDQADSAYSSGDYGRAKKAAELASTLLGQLAAEQLAKALPGPLDGWTAAEASSDSTAAAMFGGGVQAERSYNNADGQQVRLQVMMDSPLVAQMAGLYGNPALAATMGKLVKVGGQQAVLKEQGELQMLVDNRFLVTVTGDAPAEAKQTYAAAVDLSALK
jgi:hypothetical protein